MSTPKITNELPLAVGVGNFVLWFHRQTAKTQLELLENPDTKQNRKSVES